MTRNVLELPTLVLNRNWQPVHVTTVVRALVMLWNETAQVVEPDEYRLYAWADWARARARGRRARASGRRGRGSGSPRSSAWRTTTGCPGRR